MENRGLKCGNLGNLGTKDGLAIRDLVSLPIDVSICFCYHGRSLASLESSSGFSLIVLAGGSGIGMLVGNGSASIIHSCSTRPEAVVPY